MKILITGAEGFIGSHLVERLANLGHDVTCLVQYNSFNSIGWLTDINLDDKNNVKIIFGDIRDASQMVNISKNIDAICHLAALIAIPYSYAAPDQYVQTNVQGTLNLLNAARQAGVVKFIHTSTSEVYGTARYVPIDEEHPLQGQSPYSATKIAADQLVFAFGSSFELPVLTLRPFNTYGPRQSARAIIPAVISQLASGSRKLELGSLAPTRDFTYVSDTVDAFCKAIEAGRFENETLNLGTGFEISILDTVKLIAAVMGRDFEISSVQERMRPKNSEVERLVSNNTKAKSIIGWSPEHVGVEGLQSGIEKTVRWFMDDRNLSKYPKTGYVI